MNIKEFISMLFCAFGFIIGFQLGLQGVSFWIVILIAFGSGVLIFVLLNKEIFKEKKE